MRQFAPRSPGSTPTHHPRPGATSAMKTADRIAIMLGSASVLAFLMGWALLDQLTGPIEAAAAEHAAREAAAEDNPSTIKVTREAECRWAVKPPILDGVLDDPCWK